MKKNFQDFLTDVLAGGCFGLIVDYFAQTRYVFMAIGLVGGLIAAAVIKQKKDRK